MQPELSACDVYLAIAILRFTDKAVCGCLHPEWLS